MLERCFVRQETLSRIRSSWLGPAVERYAAWLHDRGYRVKTLAARVSILRQFGTFAQSHGAQGYEELPIHLEPFLHYWIVRCHTGDLHASRAGPDRHHVSPHVFRHSCGVHLLESGVDINVIRGWLGHVRLDSTNRYAEITVRAKEAALRLCEPPPIATDVPGPKPIWRDDEALLAWLASL